MTRIHAGEGLLAGLLATILTLTALPAIADEHDATISVTGNGFVMAAPDMARISMTVSERNKDVNAASAAATAAVGRVLEVLDGLDIDEKFINTTAATIRPEYRWRRETNEQELLGYIVERRISVELRDLDRLGDLVQQATAAGITNLSPPQLDHSERRDLYREALANAVADARANAATLAVATGGRLGAPVNISEGARTVQPLPVMRAQAVQADMAMESGGQTFVPGEMRFDATVSIIYTLAQ